MDEGTGTRAVAVDRTGSVPGAGRPADGEQRDGGRRGARRRGWGELALDAAVLFGLAGLAVTQPVLELFGRNPTFFVAGGYGRRQIVAFALVVAAVPGLITFAASGLPGLVHRRAGALGHGVGVAVLAGAFGLVLARSAGVDGVVPAVGLAAALGVGAALAEARWRTARRFLGLLSLGNVVFLVSFLLVSPTADLLRGFSYADAGSVRVPALDGPVTVVMLDEFPLSSIVRPDGTINEVRYPNLAALADESTWFRNASTESKTTYESVPTILSGTRPDDDDLPVLADHPRNLFTLFGRSYPVQRYEVVTDLCPAEVCEPLPGQPLRQALDDAGIVYRHQILPESLRDDLPAVDQGWGTFGDDAGDVTDDPVADPVPSDEEPDPYAKLEEVPRTDRGKGGQVAALGRQVGLVGAEPSVNFVHVLVPHHPYVLTPWGTESTGTWVPARMPDPGEPGYDRAFDELYALQAMQVGVVDQAIGDLVAHLKRVGAWDTGTFVLTSDHGVDISRPGFARGLNDETQDELLRIPLFIRGPGHQEGEVSDEPASTVDVLPSIIDLLGIETDWELEGHSLFDGSEPTIDRAVTSDLDGLWALAERQQSRFPHGEDWSDLAAIGPHGDLVGSAVSDHRLGPPSDLSWKLDHRDTLDDPAAEGGKVPVLMRGTVEAADEPPDLVVAVDGTIAGTVGGYRREEGRWAFSGILGPPGARGRGEEVVAYQVERDVGDVRLRKVAEG